MQKDGGKMIPEYEFRECLQCEYIEDCPHPTVDQSGSPIHPHFCNKKEEVKLKKRSNDNYTG